MYTIAYRYHAVRQISLQSKFSYERGGDVWTMTSIAVVQTFKAGGEIPIAFH